MSVIHNDLLLSADEATGYNLTKSVRLRSAASASLSRTPASAGNRKTWTWSAWVKRGSLTSNQFLLSTGTAGSSDASIYFSGSDFFKFEDRSGSNITTAAVHRDPSAWYHLVVVVDTTQATSSNRFKLYVNGSQITSFDGTPTYPSLNADLYINSNTLHYIGRRSDGLYFDGYQTEVNFVDGTALTPSSFGETDTITGVWKPKRFTGTYGTNGFYLPFTDVATTSGSNAGLGKDFSGNGNYWTTNNISVTAGSTYDSMTDVPTLTSATQANFAVLNPLNSSGTIANGNLQWSNNANNGSTSTIAPNTGKWYAEFIFSAINSGVATFGISNLLTTSAFSGATQTWQLGYSSAGKLENAGSQTTVATYTTSDVVAVAFDCSTGAATFYKNNTSVGTITNAAFANVPVMLGLGSGGSPSGTSTGTVNFGQQPFTYTPPTGFKALNTYNLPDSTIVAGNKYMEATLYTGNGSTQSITNAGAFKPDLVWVKARSLAYGHGLTDSVRGTTKILGSNNTNAEQTVTDEITAFNSNGFSLGAATGGYSNVSGGSYVGWQWQAGQGTTSSNTSGSITSTVSVNPSAGFSIVSYTGTLTSAGNATIGHGLGVAPSLIISKRTTGGTSEWVVQTPFLGQNKFLILNSTGALQDMSSVGAGTLSLPTSTTFGSTYYTGLNVNTQPCIAYCWAEVAGFSKFGSYTGNGSTDGTFVYTGFRPKFILTKLSSGADQWYILDSSRDTYNVAGLDLAPNQSTAEVNDKPVIDFLSNGYKLRCTYGSYNGSGSTYIYAAFAEVPFKNSLGR